MRKQIQERLPHLSIGPPIEVTNAPEVLDWYNNHIPDPGTTTVIHRLASKVLKPEVHYEIIDGTSAEQVIQQHLEANKVIAWTPDHSAIVDPVQLASAARRERALNLLMGNTKVASKPGNFKIRPIRYIIDSFGAFVVFRSEDKEYVPMNAHEGEAESPKALAMLATEDLIANTLKKT